MGIRNTRDERQNPAGAATCRRAITEQAMKRKADILGNSFERLAAEIQPREHLTISQWAARHAWLPKAGGRKEKFHPLPWQIEMLDDPLNPNASTIVWVMASQVAGKTQIIIIVVEYHIHQRPTGIQV